MDSGTARGLQQAHEDIERAMKNTNGVFKEQQEKEMVNHPKHYNQYDMETIAMVEKIWGKDAVIIWCEITAFKYRMRLGLKEGNPIEQDLAKEKWYLDYAKHLKERDRRVEEK